jgi:hypothetical protein
VLSHRGGWRVAIVVRPLDRALGLLRLGLIPLAVLAASLPTFQAIDRTFGAPSDGWAVGLTGLGVALAYVLLLQTHAVSRQIDLVFARARRRVTMRCNRDVAGGDDDASLACWLTPELLRAPLFRYEQQTSAVRTLTDACRQDRPGQYWFLEGKSGTGKTRTGLLLVQALIRDLKLLEFGSRSYLYDFGESESAQDAFVTWLGRPRHEQAVVVVDDFQRVRPDVLRDVTHRLVYDPNPLPERLILFLTRPPDAWNLSPGSEVRLVSEAKTATRHLELVGPPAESVARSLHEFDPTASQLVWDLQDDPIASAPQLHLAQVIARNRATPPEVAAILRLLAGDVDYTTPRNLVRVLAVVTALSMHRGTFSSRAFRRAVRAASDDATRRTAAAESVRLRLTLRRLRRIGLISRTHRPGTRYVFHEAIAKLCIDRLSMLPAFQIPFTVAARSRLRDLASPRDALTRWLAAVEIGAQDVAEASFDAAVANGPYTRMLRCLRRACARYPLSAALRLQLAILLDRTGDFAASREEFTEELVRRLDPLSELSAVFTATRLEASHDPASIAGLELLRDHPDRLVAIVGEYWRLHLAAHQGSFASEKLLELATEALGLLKSRESHWLNYSLGRMHFDSLRHYYLAGGAPASAVDAPERRALGTYLRPRLATYDAFDFLYTKAHFVGHVLLPQVAIFFEPVTRQQAALADVRPEDVDTVGHLVETAQRLYRRAQDEFWQYGDREAAYLEADILNTAMIDDSRDLDALTDKLHDYQRFITETGFKDLASYPHLYFVRWHVLRRYRALRGGASDLRTIDEELDAARWHLRRIVELDTEVHNEYGLMRAKVLEVLLLWLLEPPRAEELKGLSANMAARGYGREERLLAHLAGRGPLPILELERIFRFYPFVHQ